MVLGNVDEVWEYFPVPENIPDSPAEGLWGPSADAFVVRFDGHGKAKELRRPLRGPYASRM
jgi:hypothetical protein